MSSNSGSETIGVVGLGYVGLPLALAMTEAGYEVVGVDIDDTRIEALQAGHSYVTDVPDERIQRMVDKGFRSTTEYDRLSMATGISICVPTPLRKSGQPDISYIVEATEQLSEVIESPCTVVLESTVYPGATEEIIAPRLVENGNEIGEDMFVGFSPERIDPANEEYGPKDIPKVFGGLTPACGDQIEALYKPVFDELVRVNSAMNAEMVKLLENTFRNVNIALINELATIAHKLEADIWEVIDAAATKPFGYMPFYPGPGLGGHCIPVDPQYLSWKAGQHGIDTRFVDLADEINRRMPVHVVDRIVKLLNQAGTPVPDSRILLVGAAYKPNVTDTRESPALDVLELLESNGATVTYHDPHVQSVSVDERVYESVPLTREQLCEQDCVVVITDHDDIDMSKIADHAPLVFDTRNSVTPSENVHRL